MTEQQTPYEALASAGSDPRWAFGSGFEDPLAGVDTAVREGVDGFDLGLYCMMLGDDALVASHRLQEWLTYLPELEEEVAIANIALDLLGQARMLLSRAGSADGTGRDEDVFAFDRDQAEWRNVRLVEPPDRDFAGLVVRLLCFATWRWELFWRLQSSADPVLSAIAEKGVKELTYHRDFAAEWVVRLGSGTDTSRHRTEAALLEVWPFIDELFLSHSVELSLKDSAVDPALLRTDFDAGIDKVLRAAGLVRPHVASAAAVAGRRGRRPAHGASRPLIGRAAGRRPRPPRSEVVSTRIAAAWEIAAAVPDPEMPYVTVADLGILRGVAECDGRTIVTISPTFSGCPALTEIRRDLHDRLVRAGFGPVEIRTALSPAWTTDWITPEGRRKLASAGVAPPRGAPRSQHLSAVRLQLSARDVACPRCGSLDTAAISSFGATACKALYHCHACDEPFERLRAI